MAEWVPPKTNWSVEDVPGSEDFKRIEGNAEYLKTQTDGIKSGSIKVGKASYADSAGQVKSGTVNLSAYGSGSKAIIKHDFNSYALLVSVSSGAYKGNWRFVDANRIEIMTGHSGSETSNPVYPYRYTIYKP